MATPRVNTVDASLPFSDSSSACPPGSPILECKFTPVNRFYVGIVTNQTAQDYDTLVFGDTASSFPLRTCGWCCRMVARVPGRFLLQ